MNDAASAPDPTPLHASLEAARRDLLDLSARNRLLSTPRNRKRSSSVEIVDELSEEVFRILAIEGKTMKFEAAKETPKPAPSRQKAGEDEAAEVVADEDIEEDALPQPEAAEEEELDERGVAVRHADDLLQTALTSETLQKRLLRLFYDARTCQEEQGVNILYLALGFLKWIDEPGSSKARFAPLLLLPVELRRPTAGARFRLRVADQDLDTNLSLQAKLKSEFNIHLPDIPESLDDLSPNAYFEQVRQAIAGRKGWEVLPNDMVLWLFSFSKFLMYRDLDPANWPGDKGLDSHPLIQGLLASDGFVEEQPVFDGNLDEALPPEKMIHVMDADSSQTEAVENVRHGHSLVIQGPPGTGKSQTITNMIAAVVQQGKTVLFVAEKMAALEVVKRRMDNIGLGDMCLELHSRKAAKREVLENLGGVMELGKPKMESVRRQAKRLAQAREHLNRHVKSLHTPLAPCRVTAFEAIGELACLQGRNVPPPDFSLESPLAWTPAEVRQKRTLLSDLAGHLAGIGDPRQHPWRGVMVDTILPMDIQRLVSQLPDAAARAEQLIERATALAATLGEEDWQALGDVDRLIDFANHVLAVPSADLEALAEDIWRRRRQAIDDLLEQGEKLAACREKLSGVAAEVAWTTDLAKTRRDLAAHGSSWLRWFSGDYRQARSTLKGILDVPLPRTLDERLSILDTLIEGQQAQWAVDVQQDNQQLGQEAFGNLWRGASSEWPALRKVETWERECRAAKLPKHFRQTAAQVSENSSLDEQAKAAAESLRQVRNDAAELFESVKLSVSTAYDVESVDDVPVADLNSRWETWHAQPESVTNWIAYRTRWEKLADEGMQPLAKCIDEGEFGPDDLLDQFNAAYYEAVVREAFRSHPDLAEFNGASHEKILQRFCKLDEERIEFSRLEVAMAHYQRIPAGGFGVGELGLVRREIQKKRRHLPLRQLLKQAGNAVQAIKPVFMMSPISIAQYLEPGQLEFDLLVIDEASQIMPVDALGAIARAKQIVIVGDDRQLPPTQFFNKVAAGETFDDEAVLEGVRTGDLESILGLCVAQNLPQRMLRWHYRSRHHSLIAVSNREFYDSRLNVVPSPVGADETLGLVFHHVPDGVFDRGRSACNQIEAKVVAEAAVAHARARPQETLGIAAFSVAQRDAIVDELERLRRENTELEPFFSTEGAEPFFVKNLENVQGDERDVIFISVGYAPAEDGKMSMFFGPLSYEGGERRLNVLITRSRMRCEVFSSITADQIDLGRTQSRGAASLKTFLAYAEHGLMGPSDAVERNPSAALEREIADALAREGWEVDHQVGVSGFFVDLAVVDPERDGRYLLGVECDGPQYLKAEWARDRDRLRQQILTARGWTLHRIWSPDWFHRPEEQLQNLLAALGDAQSAVSRGERNAMAAPAGSSSIQSIERSDDDDSRASDIEDLTAPYQEANFKIRGGSKIADMKASQLAEHIRRVVKEEGPIHKDLLVRRVASLAGLRRASSRCAATIEDAMAAAVRRKWVTEEDSFYQDVEMDQPPLRNRSGASSVIRKPEMLPPGELRRALELIVETQLGASRDDAVVKTARLLGYRSTSPSLREIIEQQVERFVEQGRFVERNGMLYLA